MRYFENAVVMLPIAAVLAALIYLPILIYLHKARKVQLLKHIANFTFTGYCLMLIWVVFFWMPGSPVDWEHRINVVPFSEVVYAYQYDGGLWSSQVMWNVFLFIPLGFLLPCVFYKLRKGAWKTILFCLSLTIAIEAIQLLIGRTADIDDILANLTGGVFGHAVYVLFSQWFKKPQWAHCLFAPPPQKYRVVLSYIAAALILGVPTIGDILLKIATQA
ncbi:MAG: VanZ family protein [Clostridia bacterium]|nr:VanZ family protein [Clostridia bacterium]